MTRDCYAVSRDDDAGEHVEIIHETLVTTSRSASRATREIDLADPTCHGGSSAK